MECRKSSLSAMHSGDLAEQDLAFLPLSCASTLVGQATGSRRSRWSPMRRCATGRSPVPRCPRELFALARNSHRRPAACRRGRRQGQREARRQMPAALFRPPALGRGHRPRPQAALAGRARLARHEADPLAEAGRHRREDSIRAHVVLCWLALLLLRVIETTCEESRPQLRRDLQKLGLAEPPRSCELTPAAP